MPRGEAGENSCHANAQASAAEQMRFCLKTHNNKLLMTKKAVSSYYAKAKLTCQGL
jgi:hypothetical protein